MPAEYDYRVIYLKRNRPHCYGNVTWPEARPAGPDLRAYRAYRR